MFGQFETKSGENAKSTYLLRTFVQAFLTIKPAIGSISSGEKLGNTLELSDATCTTKVSFSGSSAAAITLFYPLAQRVWEASRKASWVV